MWLGGWSGAAEALRGDGGASQIERNVLHLEGENVKLVELPE